MRRLIRIVGSVVAAIVLLAVALSFLVDANTFRPTLESRLGEALGRRVRLGDLRLKLLSGAVSADNLSISDDPAFSKGAFLEARSIKIGVELLPLIFSRKLNVTRLVIEEPKVSLVQAASGEWNFSTLGRGTAPKPAAPPASADKPMDLSVRLVRIDDGQFSLTEKGSKQRPLALEKVNLELRDFSASSSFPFSFRAKRTGGGEIKLEGNAGPLPQGDASRIPFHAKLDIDKWNLDGAGLVSLDGAAQSEGTVASVRGKLRAEQLKLADRGTPAAKPVELTFAAEHKLADGSGRVSQGELRIGAAAAKLGGSYATRGESTVLHMTLAGDQMPVPELAAMLPSLGVALPAGASLQGGTATVKLAMDGAVSRLVTTGTVSLNDTTVGGFDLGRKLAVLQALAGIQPNASTKIQTLAGAIRMSHEGTAADNLQLVVPSIGEMVGAGTISPANALDFKMTARVSGQSIPFLVTGTMADPAFRPDVKAVVTDKAKGVAEGLLKGLFNPKKD